MLLRKKWMQNPQQALDKKDRNEAAFYCVAAELSELVYHLYSTSDEKTRREIETGVPALGINVDDLLAADQDTFYTIHKAYLKREGRKQ